MPVFEKLNDENYANWVRDIKVLLVERELWDIVVGVETAPIAKEVKVTELKPTTSPEKSVSEESKEFKKKCNLAFSIIYYNIDPQLRGILNGCTDPVLAWKSISDHYQPKSIAQEMRYISELFECRPDVDESIGNFARRINLFVERLRSIDQPVVDRYVAF